MEPEIDPEEFRRLYALRWGHRRLAAHFGISERWAREIRIELGLTPHEVGAARHKPEQVKAANELFERGGITIVEAATQCGITRGALQAYRDKLLKAGRATNMGNGTKVEDADLAMRRETERMIREWDRRRARAGGVPWSK